MKTIRVLVADDHPLYRRGLVDLLEEVPGIEVVGEATNGLQAVKLVEQVKPDLVLMDVVMPEGGGILATRRICQDQPQVKVLMLTVSEGNETLFEALAAGASGYLLKEIEPDDLIQAIEQVMRGQAPMSPAIAAKVLQRFRYEPLGEEDNLTEEPPPLTSREVEIIGLLAQGLTNQEIARRLVVATTTIKTHIHNLLRKTRTHNRAELVAWGMQAGLIDISTQTKDS
ncbi:MAG: response regulator transcription factor [Anaerolineae bacterium]